MKVLAISCSPSRKRNSDTMLDYFILGMKEVSGIEVEKIYLEDILINTYTYENREAPTDNEREFKKLTQKITNEISGLIIATPTYNFSVPAHLKNFIDRLRWIALDMAHKNDIGQPVGKLQHLKCYFLVSGGTPNWAERMLFFGFPLFWLRAVFLFFGADVMGGLYSGDVRTFASKRILKQCERRGERYARKLVREQRHGILER